MGTVGFGATSGTDYQSGNGSSGAQTLLMPSGAVAGDYVWILRHHSAANNNMTAGPGTNGTIFSDGYIASGTDSSVGYYANGSTALMGTYRKVQGGDGNWSWTPAGTDFTWATVRFTGADPTTPFVGGTGNGTVDAGAGRGSGNPITFTVGNAVAGDMGVVVIACNSATAPTASAGWTVSTLRSGATRNLYMARRAYTGTVTADSVTLTFGASVSWVSRHGVIKAAPGNSYSQSVGGTITPTSTLSTGIAKLLSGLGGTVTGVGAITRQINKLLASPTQDSFYRVVVVGDSISEGTQVGVGNRWIDLLFGSQGTIANGVWRNGSGSGVPFPSKRIYHATYQGDSVIETTNRTYTGAKTDGTSGNFTAQPVDLLIICLGANDELDALPGGITQGDDTNPAHSLQWFEDNVVQLANGGIQSGTVGANPGGLNTLPKAAFVLVVGQWQWRAAQTLAGLNGNVPTDHTKTLTRLQNAVTRIGALPHVTRAAYVHVGTHASLGQKADNSGFGTNVAVADGTDAGGGTYAIGGAGDRIHPNATGQASVYTPAIRYGIDLVTTNPTGGVAGTITATGSVPSTLKVRALAVAGIITASSTFARVVAYTRSFGGTVAAAGDVARSVFSPPSLRLRGARGPRRPRTSRRTRRQ